MSIEDLQQENDRLVAQLRQRKRRRIARRIRRVGFVLMTISRAKARRTGKASKPTVTTDSSAAKGRDQGVRLLLLALVVRRLMAGTGTPENSPAGPRVAASGNARPVVQA
jgi:hypothetical protein